MPEPDHRLAHYRLVGRFSAFLTLLLVALPVTAAGEDLPSLPEILGQGFDVVTVEGNTVPLATILGSDRPVLIEFWATWCPPCRKNFPHLVKLKKKYGDRLVVVGLTVEDPGSDLAKVREFADEYDVNFPIAFAPAELFQLMNGRTDIAVPKLFVFDGSGALVRYIPRHSPSTASKLKSAVSQVLSGSDPATGNRNGGG